jgi:alpha-L-arabinofuranosidase
MLGSARSALMKQPSGDGPALPAAMAAYGFTEGSGLTTADSSGNGRTLTLNSTSWATGHTNFALTNPAAGLGAFGNFTGPTTAISIMAWLKPLDLALGTTRFALGFVASTSSDVTFFTQRGDSFGNPNVLQCDIRLSGSGLVPVHGPALIVDTWTHVALTYDSATTTIVLYVDGVAYYTSNSSSGTISTGEEFRIAGWSSADPAMEARVTVDDVRIFNTALTADQVTLAMNTPVA